MRPLPRSKFDDEVEAQLARYPLLLKRSLNRLAWAAIDTTLTDRRKIRHYLRGLADLDATPPEVSHYLRMAAGIVSGIMEHTAEQSGLSSADVADPRDEAETLFESFPVALQQSLSRLGELMLSANSEERQAIVQLFDRLAKADRLEPTIARVAAVTKDVATASSEGSSRLEGTRYFVQFPQRNASGEGGDPE